MHPHTARPEQCARHPIHVTTRIRPGLPSLRRADSHRLLADTLRAGADRFGFRLVEYSVQSNHLHLLVEAPDREALTRGAKGMFVRLAKRLNQWWGRKGQVFPERFHARALRSPREVRRALAYVLHNARRHGSFGEGIDPHSSGAWFDGFAAARAKSDAGAEFVRKMASWRPVVRRAASWLLRSGWRRGGLIDIDEVVAAWSEPH
ncbi:MAG: hypothetical protein EPO68_01655 [Planctomycetota bacterium]|nr:MAG: hypothetical protein EPO68_01655 [Planctomycetota bacterium]